jgi:hypothetical protein
MLEHAMAQLAACRRAVGIAITPPTGFFELRGPASELSGVACRLDAHGWWRTVSPHRALFLADGTGMQDVVASQPDVAVSDLSSAYACLILAGPLAGRLAASPAARLARPLIVAHDGDDCALLVLPRDRAADTRHALLEAGRADGAVAVDARAAELHRTARRIRARQHHALHGSAS